MYRKHNYDQLWKEKKASHIKGWADVDEARKRLSKLVRN